MQHYYTLAVREGRRWGVHFGDYDLETVRDERVDLIESGEYKRRDTHIISTESADQKVIDAAIARLNGEAQKQEQKELTEATV